jgi:ABC-type transport system involved in cytochrome bd biosynthesis fused ATPase/permease subunit
VRQVRSGDTSDVSPLIDYVRDGHWVAVLGLGGAGKSMLAALLMKDLLAGRCATDPVSVLLRAKFRRRARS